MATVTDKRIAELERQVAELTEEIQTIHRDYFAAQIIADMNAVFARKGLHAGPKKQQRHLRPVGDDTA
jgi:uncharacterized coiled-coil protein SlyX